MSRFRFVVILKYLSFDDEPNWRCTGPGVYSRFTAVRIVFQTFASKCEWKHMWNFWLTVDKLLLQSRCPFTTLCQRNPINTASSNKAVSKVDWQNIE